MVKANTGFWIHTRRGQRRLRLFRGITATLLMLLISFPVCAVPPVRFAASKDSPTLIRDPGAVPNASAIHPGPVPTAAHPDCLVPGTGAPPATEPNPARPAPVQ